MEIYLVRHTKTILDKNICYGQTDINIEEPFEESFSKIIDLLPNNFSKIYSSPLSRCTRLADYIAQNKDADVQVVSDARLKELHFGEWEQKKWNEIDRKTLDAWGIDYVNYRVPGGESFTDLYKRVVDFIENNLLLPNPSEPIIIITHAGVIRSILCHLFQHPLKDAFDIKVGYGSIFRVRIYSVEDDRNEYEVVG